MVYVEKDKGKRPHIGYWIALSRSSVHGGKEDDIDVASRQHA